MSTFQMLNSILYFMKERQHKDSQMTNMKKNPYFMWENLWPYFDMWNRHFRISCQKNCLQIFITLMRKISHFMQKILYVYFFLRYVHRIPYCKVEILSPDLYTWIIDLYISHSEICIYLFIYETENFIFYVGLSHFKCLNLKQITASSKGSLILILLLSFGCCNQYN